MLQADAPANKEGQSDQNWNDTSYSKCRVTHALTAHHLDNFQNAEEKFMQLQANLEQHGFQIRKVVILAESTGLTRYERNKRERAFNRVLASDNGVERLDKMIERGLRDFKNAEIKFSANRFYRAVRASFDYPVSLKMIDGTRDSVAFALGQTAQTNRRELSALLRGSAEQAQTALAAKGMNSLLDMTRSVLLDWKNWLVYRDTLMQRQIDRQVAHAEPGTLFIVATGAAHINATRRRDGTLVRDNSHFDSGLLNLSCHPEMLALNNKSGKHIYIKSVFDQTALKLRRYGRLRDDEVARALLHVASTMIIFSLLPDSTTNGEINLITYSVSEIIRKSSAEAIRDTLKPMMELNTNSESTSQGRVRDLCLPFLTSHFGELSLENLVLRSKLFFQDPTSIELS